MNKLFGFSLVALIWIYFNVPELSSFIQTIGVTIFIFNLAAIFSNSITHSPYLPNKLFVKPTKKLVLITGCDSGFGLAAAKRLDRYGFHVIAGVLSDESEGCKYLKTHGSNRLHTIKLDVTKKDEINDFVNLVAYLTNYKPLIDKLNDDKSKLKILDKKNSIFGSIDGNLELHGLINNAGVGKFLPFEFGSIDQDLIPMFEVNVFGMIRLTKLLLPMLRKGEGRIVNLGSVSDRLTIGGLTGYCMSKHAVRSFTDGLRQELQDFKVKPILIEPTLYKTPISNIDQLLKHFNSAYERTDDFIKSEYGDQEFKDSFTAHLKKMVVLTRSNINEVVDSVEDAITNMNPKDQYWCASTLQCVLYWFVEQFHIRLVDFICTMKPPQSFIDFVQEINDKI